jgi:hypothetical protein
MKDSTSMLLRWEKATTPPSYPANSKQRFRMDVAYALDEFYYLAIQDGGIGVPCYVKCYVKQFLTNRSDLPEAGVSL